MNQGIFVERLYERLKYHALIHNTKFPRMMIELVLQEIIHEITEAVAHGEPIRLRKFGKFFAKRYGPRSIYSPADGVHKELRRRHLPTFRPSSVFKRRVEEVRKMLGE